jgi:tetratricopeptide (TPR) repeat protein
MGLKRNIFLFSVLLLQVISFKVFSQNADSLTSISKQEKEDSLILAAQLESLEAKKNSGDKKGISISYHNIGQLFYDKGDYRSAVEYFMLSLITCREMNDDIGIANCYQNLADAHKNLAHYAEGIRYYSDAIDMYSELGYKDDIADCYMSISKIYEIKKDISDAISYTRKAQNIYSDERNRGKVDECATRIKELRSKR